jgi:hypothetical protein
VKPADRVTVEGVLERVVFQSEDDGFTVAKLQLPGKRDLVTIGGNLLSANPGETLRLRGKWVVNVKFGGAVSGGELPFRSSRYPDGNPEIPGLGDGKRDRASDGR